MGLSKYKVAAGIVVSDMDRAGEFYEESSASRWVRGGANIAQQCLKVGLVDEMQIHLVPVLLGAGIRLFDHTGAERIKLERTGVIESPSATHLRFRVVKED